jgi:tetratricopeptide (TPR) repeat protein
MTPSLRCILLLTFLFVRCSPDHGIPTDAVELLEKAKALFHEKSYRQSEMMFAQAMLAFEQGHAYATLAEISGYMGRIALEEGEFAAAIEQIESGLRHARLANDYREEMRLQSFLGDVYRAMGEYEKAYDAYQVVRELASAFSDAATTAETEYNLAVVLLYDGKEDQARELCENAVAYYRTRTDPHRLGSALWLLGDIFVRQKRYSEALNILNQAEAAAERSTDSLLVSRVKLSLGRLYRTNGNSVTALRYFRDATNSLRSRKGPKEFEPVLLFEIGNVYFEAGQYDNARRFFNDAATIARTAGDRIAENFLYLHIVRCNEKLADIQKTPANAERVARAYRQLAPRFADILCRSGEALCYARAAAAYETSRMQTTAREMYVKVISLLEEKNGEYWSPELHEPYLREISIPPEGIYDRLASLLVELRAPGEALAILERSQQARYQHQFRRRDIEVRHPQLKDEMLQMRNLLRDMRMVEVEVSALLGIRQRASASQRINELRAKLNKGKSDIPKLAAKIVSLYPNYEPLTAVVPPKLLEVQSSLPRGTLAVRFLPTENRLLIFALSRTRFEVKSSPVARHQLAGMMQEYNNMLQDPRVYAGTAGEASVPLMTRFARLSTQLYDYLIRPLEPLLERNLVIITDSFIDGFPLHALERQEPNGVKYLIEITNVDYLPTLSSFRYRTASALRIRTIVAAGNPLGKNWSIDYELRDIRSFFKDASIFIGMEASWQSLSRARGDVLQIATQFIQDEREFPCGSIVLADGQTPEKEQLVPFAALASINPFPLIFLSNQIGSGTGLTSTHALLLRMNGSSDVFLNAWTADRKAAKFFSEFFYTYLSNGLAPGDAYRQALLNLIKTREVNHPRSWAQFFHFGIG